MTQAKFLTEIHEGSDPMIGSGGWIQSAIQSLPRFSFPQMGSAAYRGEISLALAEQS
jgi:hypothetical protein